MKSWKTGIWLFGVNLYISTFTFGGGYIVIPMIRKIFVQQKQLFTESELLEMAAIAQSSPGAIAVNLSVLAGRRTLGLAGALISAVSAVLPSFIILALISSCYDAFRTQPVINACLKGMEAGVAALIVQLVYEMSAAILKQKQTLHSLILPVTFFCGFILEIPAMTLLLFWAGLSLVLSFLDYRRARA